MGKELFDSYPPFLNAGNKLYPLKNIAKKYNSLEEFYFAYSSAIKHSIDSHKEIMELLEWGKENGHISYSIVEFVISRKWIELKELRDNGITIVLGTDGIGSTTTMDMFEEMKTAAYLQKVNTMEPTSINAYEILKITSCDPRQSKKHPERGAFPGLNDREV